MLRGQTQIRQIGNQKVHSSGALQGTNAIHNILDGVAGYLGRGSALGPLAHRLPEIVGPAPDNV
jgi:hypothetical protein